MNQIQNEKLVVWISHKGEDHCEQCGAGICKGDFLQPHRELGIRCLKCASLDDLEFLPSGDAALTQRATKYSSRSVVVVKFSRVRKRNERQGILAEPQAIKKAEEECEKDAADREQKRMRRRQKDAELDQQYILRFGEKIRECFPCCPTKDARAIAEQACRKYSGRVGRTAAAKAFDEQAVFLAVQAYVRHHYTRYDDLLAKGLEPTEARPMIADDLQEKLHEWRGADLELNE